MTEKEEKFLERLRATFNVEAEEHAQAISAGLLELEQTPVGEKRTENVETIFRHIHSLKGAARAVNFGRIETICQTLEDVFAAYKDPDRRVSAEAFDLLHRAIDLVGGLLTPGIGEHDVERRVSDVVRQLRELTFGGGLGPAPRGPAKPPAPVAAGSDPNQKAGQIPSPNPGPTPAPGDTSSREAPLTFSPRPALAETIRISTAKLDRLFLEAEEMLAVKQSAARRAADLRQLDSFLKQWGSQWARVQPHVRELRKSASLPNRSQVMPGPGQSSLPGPEGRLSETGGALSEFLDWNCDFVKSLEGKVVALAKSATHEENAFGKLVDELLADSRDLLMLPFSILSDLFPKLVRDLSRDQGKEADLILRGSEVAVDKRILEEMKDPLIHLVRNCIDHGIERPEQRAIAKKPLRGTITIAVAPVDGNKVEIVVSDDGAGIDLPRVKESAVKHGIISIEESPQMPGPKALDLVFQSAVSTTPIITEISGRGLGLAIVREKTEKLGGRVSVESSLHGGTTLRMVLPLKLATFRGILVRVAGQEFVIPAAHVERAGRCRPAEIQSVENRETIVLNGRALSLASLARVLEITVNTRSPAADFIPFVVLGSADERMAFAVEEVLHDQEVIVKSLPRPLSRVRNIAGATVLASGKVAPILNALDLIKSARKAGATPQADRAGASPAAQPSKPKTVLLAEDSITSRMLLKGILESAGYKVKTAVDGVEAWTALREEDFDIVVSDIEMPRMNGFDLTVHIRGDKRLAEKPVVLVTALSSQEDRERGIDAGANAYLVKSSFDQSNLLDVVRRLA